jgi:hypothetical protein
MPRAWRLHRREVAIQNGRRLARSRRGLGASIAAAHCFWSSALGAVVARSPDHHSVQILPGDIRKIVFNKSGRNKPSGESLQCLGLASYAHIATGTVLLDRCGWPVGIPIEDEKTFWMICSSLSRIQVQGC